MGIISVPYFIGEEMSGFDVPAPHVDLTPHLPSGPPQRRMAMLYALLADQVAADDAPAVFAGDCLSIIGVLAGLQRKQLDPTLVFFDAHGDFHTWETTPSKFLGGMPLAMVTGRGEQTVVEGAGMATIRDEKVILVDGRDLDPGEDDAVASSGVTVESVEEVAHRLPPEGPLYVHIDVDVVDPLEMPAVNFPAHDGPSLADVRAALIHLAATNRVVATSVSGWNPALPGATTAAAATRRLVAPLLAVQA